ncbi:MAG: xanthine dehydrogenase accessory protein XdhC, partial [Rhodobacteraceae bacterium]|nr:xanthine dehydrogenase accessory protein XdhC [Paracoccaceae bacterium]
AGGQEGTIGGGALEYQAASQARAMLAAGEAARWVKMPLGPALNQCCGGVVGLLCERWDRARLADLAGPVLARPLPGKSADMPLPVVRLLARARQEGILPAPRLVQGWFIEPMQTPQRPLWVWGAGHVGRAIVSVLAPLPDLGITWVDTDSARFPDLIPERVTRRISTHPAALVHMAPAGADHLVLTFSHALDLDLSHRLLGLGFASLGLIGSATKWARFRTRLAALGHAPEQISRITCPIGRPDFGKHPQAIALGVAADFLDRKGIERITESGAPRLRQGG